MATRKASVPVDEDLTVPDDQKGIYPLPNQWDLYPELQIQRLRSLQEPFPASTIGKKPKFKADQSKKPMDCTVCGGWHLYGARAVHLDFVGHAALTARLLHVDPYWDWRPVGFTPEGLPLIDGNGGLWIRLTICGVTHLGYGDDEGGKSAKSVKVMIGDAMRNAGIRFGLALDLWSNNDLSELRLEQGQKMAETEVIAALQDEAAEGPTRQVEPASVETDADLTAWDEMIEAATDSVMSATLKRIRQIAAERGLSLRAVQSKVESDHDCKLADLEAAALSSLYLQLRRGE